MDDLKKAINDLEYKVSRSGVYLRMIRAVCILVKKQKSMLMNMRIRVRLPDKDFAVGSSHLLVLSVMAMCVYFQYLGVSYSGQTNVFIRTAKHSSAYSHHEDLIKTVDYNPGSN